MSLLSAIPGLSAHEVSVPVAAPVVVSFDNDAAMVVIRRAIEEVAMAFPAPDPWGWLQDNRSDVISELKKAGNDMNVAYLAEDLEQVKVKAERFVKLHLRAWELYVQRPPVIEVQERLL